MADLNDLNLSIIWQQYRMTAQAKGGYEALITLIRDDKRRRLNQLLRYHHPYGISEEETYVRDDVDQLINAYMVLMVAILAGRVSSDLPDELTREIKDILGHPIVQRYYRRRYPLALPQVLFAMVTDAKVKQRVEDVAARVKDPGVFDAFAGIDREIENDKDVDKFLGLMDDYRFRGKSFKHLLALLANPEQLREKLSSETEKDDVLRRGAKGLFKYIAIMDEYRELLEGSVADPVLASAFWHKQGYWFDGIQEDFGERLNTMLVNLHYTVERTEVDVNKDFIFSKEDIAELKVQAEAAAKQSIADVNFVLQERWRTPLLQLFNDDGPLGPTGGGGQSVPVSPRVPVEVEYI